MNRRAAVRAILASLGGAALWAERYAAGQANPDAAAFRQSFSRAERELLEEVSEVILPWTEESAGAKEAGVGRFIQTAVAETFTMDERLSFRNGLAEIEAESQRRFGTSFMALAPRKRQALLLVFEENGAPFWSVLKELAIFGYFTSELGSTQALSHLPVPGRWDPCMEVGPEARPWS